MGTVLQTLSNFSAAEEFFEFFGVPFEPAVVHVNRLHILKRLNQYMRVTPGLDAMENEQQFGLLRGLLLRAYEDFVYSSAAQEKVFKVFQDVDGTQHVGLDSLRVSLPTRAV